MDKRILSYCNAIAYKNWDLSNTETSWLFRCGQAAQWCRLSAHCLSDPVLLRTVLLRGADNLQGTQRLHGHWPNCPAVPYEPPARFVFHCAARRDVPMIPNNRTPPQVGWDKQSYGYHGDDGNSFSSSGNGQTYGPTFTTGDVIGCCVNFVNNTCFYTKNGVDLGIAFRDLPVRIQWNFKTTLSSNFMFVYLFFLFRLSFIPLWAYRRLARKWMPTLVRNHSSSTRSSIWWRRCAPMCSARSIDIHICWRPQKTWWIGAFLLNVFKNHGLTQWLLNCLAWFPLIWCIMRSAKPPRPSMATQIRLSTRTWHRSRHVKVRIFAIWNDNTHANFKSTLPEIIKLILTGKMSQAIEHTLRSFPGLLENNKNLWFALKCRQFIEMINGADIEVGF